MSKFFVDRDYVPSDLLAGLALVETRQKQSLRKIKNADHHNGQIIGQTFVSYDTQIYNLQHKGQCNETAKIWRKSLIEIRDQVFSHSDENFLRPY